jgi:hypothetical protein
MSAADEARALLWRTRERQVKANRRRVGKALRGDPAALAELNADWLPLRRALDEARDTDVDDR